MEITKQEIADLIEQQSPRAALVASTSKSKYMAGYKNIEVDGKATPYLKCKDCPQIIWSSRDNRKTIRGHWIVHHPQDAFVGPELKMARKELEETSSAPATNLYPKPSIIVLPEWDPLHRTFRGVVYKRMGAASIDVNTGEPPQTPNSNY